MEMKKSGTPQRRVELLDEVPGSFSSFIVIPEVILQSFGSICGCSTIKQISSYSASQSFSLLFNKKFKYDCLLGIKTNIQAHKLESSVKKINSGTDSVIMLLEQVTATTETEKLSYLQTTFLLQYLKMYNQPQYNVFVCVNTFWLVVLFVAARSGVDGLGKLRGVVSLAHQQPHTSIQENLSAKLLRGHLYDSSQGPGELRCMTVGKFLY